MEKEMTEEEKNYIYSKPERIKGHPNYAVTPGGSVVNIKTGRILKADTSSRGYAKVDLDGVKVYVHRLVAETFIKNPDNKKFVMHKNGDILDNRFTNLMWSDTFLPQR